MANRDWWVFLFLLGIVLFNWPFLGIFDTLLPYYLFVIWGVFILALWRLSHATRRPDRPH